LAVVFLFSITKQFASSKNITQQFSNNGATWRSHLPHGRSVRVEVDEEETARLMPGEDQQLVFLDGGRDCDARRDT
jgi:hypothetical protein